MNPDVCHIVQIHVFMVFVLDQKNVNVSQVLEGLHATFLVLLASMDLNVNEIVFVKIKLSVIL